MSTPRVSVLRGDQADRLQSCLNTIQAATGHHMFESCIDALEQLRDFCEGSANLLPVIGSRDYSTIPILVGVLRERDVTTSVMVFQLLEYLLYNIRKNQKVFLRVEDSIALLVSFMRDIDSRCNDTDRLMFVEKSCILLSCLMKDAKKQFAEAHGLQAIHTVLKHMANVEPQRWTDDWDSVAESLFDLVIEVVEEDPRNQASFRKCGALKTMIEMLMVKENNGSIIREQYAESLLLAINSAIACNNGNQDFFRSMGAVEPLLRLLVLSENEDVYLSALLLCVSLQYENPGVQSLTADAVAMLSQEHLEGWDESRLLPMDRCLKSVYVFRDECDNIRANHFDCDVVAASLKTLTEAIKHFQEGQYVFMHQKGAMELVVQCCNNIDESIMEAALSFVYQLLLSNTRTQVAFLERGGLSSMSDCLHDYNVRIKLLALQILSIVAAEHPVCRDEVRDAGILTHILRMLRLFPSAEDVDLAVADAALGVLGHAVTENSQNQEHTRQLEGGLSCIVNILKYCMENDPEHTQVHHRNERLSNAKTAFAPTAFATIRSSSVLNGQQRSAAGVMETALVALSNLAFKNAGNQNELRELNIVQICLQFLNTSPPEDLEIATLNLVVNLVDTNSATQDQLSVPWTAQVVSRLLHQQPRVATMGCLFLSHMVWNHPQNQDLLATAETIEQILHMIDAPSTDDMDVDMTKVAISGRSSPVSAHSAYSNEENRPLQGHIRAAPRQGPQKSGGIDAFASGNGIPGPPGVMAGQGRHRLVTREQEMEELCFYALMALINLSYQNERVQGIVQQLDGVEIILKHLSSPIYETRKTATFCLGNLVKSHEGNAKKLVDAGGVERMIQLLNDEEEDELSNKAFLTLTNMGELCITRIVELVDKCLSLLEDHQDGMPYMQAMDGMSTNNPVVTRALSDLEKSLPVLNGLIYLHPENRDCMIQIQGISYILNVFTKEVPEPLVIYAGFVLANLSFTRDRELQAQARRLGAFSLIENFIDTAQEEGRVICYTVLNNLTLNNTTNYTEIMKCSRVIRHMLQDAANSACDDELRVEAAELLLSLFEQESHHEQLVNLGGLSAVEGLVSAPSSVISAKATQALRDLAR